jgi:GNAT superfamily N-acetyltransferase
MRYEIRAARADEWRKAKRLRLAALRDPVSAVAFVRTYEAEAAMSDEQWRQRALRRSFVAEDAHGEWVGSVTVLVETGAEFAEPQTHLVGVYVRPEVRGRGVAGTLLGAAIEWSWGQPERVGRVRLWVHEDNARARAFYDRLGFTPTGRTDAFPLDPSRTEYELELRRPAEAGRD